MDEIEIDALEVLQLVQEMEPRLVELAVERVRSRKLAELLAEMQEEAHDD